MSNKVGVKILFFALVFAVAIPAMAQKGSLFIIGGGDRSPALIQSLIKTAGMGAKDYIIVLPMSSGEPEASYEAIKKQLNAASKNTVGYLNFDASTVNNQKWLDSLTRAKLIFITGGDQTRFMKAVLNTPVYAAIHKAYRNGATIAGTSAGAAVMSKHMITGKQLLDTAYKETFNKLWTKNIEFEEGMGLLDSVIIDQHFLKRSRFNRLISALNAYPGYQCIGIDEGTAIIVHGKKVTIAGVSQVLKISDPVNLKTNGKQLIKMDDLRFSLYTEGDQFSLK
ncbi:MAG: cyanophycinase [Candidatus Pedobacter colombiensis]|uniref:Cyanophycinase n=1 Tax=Candidatus Pedobacter colombiensis TaxID=3121371 RepID=A0AAJ6B9B7_9SPHI|nr:cyanophycinase [Pedobacter sp.]WEK20013.1 MAG: cyanophycinase [Pedobacter sp.]